MRGSSNVFADLGLANAEEHLAKAELALAISRAIKERGLMQREAADLMGIDQPKVSHMLRGQLADFGTERLMGFLTALGRDVSIVVRPAPKSRKRGALRRGVVRAGTVLMPEGSNALRLFSLRTLAPLSLRRSSRLDSARVSSL